MSLPDLAPTPAKRNRTGMPVIPSLLSLSTSPPWGLSGTTTARFFLLTAVEYSESFMKISPFFIHRALTAAIGEAKKVKKLKSGDLLVETSGDYQTAALRVVNTLAHSGKSITVAVSDHPTLNHSYGTVYCPDFSGVPEEDLLEDLQPQSVTSLTRVSRMKNGTSRLTHLYKVGFDLPSPPTHITAGYLRLSVTQYIPPPFRCLKCLKFGHSVGRCRAEAPTCKACGGKADTNHSCGLPSCLNCGGKHSPWSKTCPIYMREVAIQEIRIRERLSLFEARRLYHQRNPQADRPLPQAAKDFPLSALHGFVLLCHLLL